MSHSPRAAAPRRLVILSLVPALVLGMALLPGSAQAQKVRPGFWGMHHGDWSTPPPVPVGAANLTTSGTYWPSIETSPKVFDWDRLDRQVAGARARGAKPMVVLGQTPGFAVAGRMRPAVHEAQVPKTSLWRRYVSRVAQRYGRKVDYQIWPEPNIIQNWRGSPRQMAWLTAVASRAITQQAGRGATVVSPAVAVRLRGQQRWMVRYFQQKVGGQRVHRYVDAIAVDPFPRKAGAPEGMFRLVRQVRAKLRRIGVRKPLWSNEINYGVAGAGAKTNVRLPVRKQQSYVIRTYALSAAAGLKRVYWLGWFSTPTMAVDMADGAGSPLPAGRSYGVARSWLNGTNVTGCWQRRGLWTCVARKGRWEVRRIYWKQRGRAWIRTPRATKRVENMHGHVITRANRRPVRVTFRPIMVASRR